MDCSKNVDMKNNEITSRRSNPDDTSRESGGCCCGNSWKMIAVIILFAIFWILTRRV
jgi:hypothetical protein